MSGDFCKQKTTFLNLQFKNGVPMLNKSNHLVQLMDARMRDYPVERHRLLRATSSKKTDTRPMWGGSEESSRENLIKTYSMPYKVKKEPPYRSKVFCLLFRMSICQHQYFNSQMRGIGLQNWRGWDDKFLRNFSRLPKTMTQILGWLDNPPMRTTVSVNGEATSSVSPSWLVNQPEKLLT